MFLMAKDNTSKNGSLLQVNWLMSHAYETYCDKETQMLFIELFKENTFGN